jgi:hypothetical protein
MTSKALNGLTNQSINQATGSHKNIPVELESLKKIPPESSGLDMKNSVT